MYNLYCIPGMGVDERLFKFIRPRNCTVKHIKWQTPFPAETLPDYAKRLAEQIDTSKPFVLIGVSFGGMCCTEIAKHLHPVKTFVVSSCKTSDELPKRITFWKNLALYKKLSDERYIQGALFVKRQFGVKTKEQTAKFLEMLRAAPKNYFAGAVHCIMHWNNKLVPDSVVHIHGTADLVLPYRKIKHPNYTIDGGTHFMVVDKAIEINRIIEKELGLG